jgi:pyrroline-5-carboxylate reductase
MTEPTVGCIGAGNMGGAILKGLASHHALRLLGHDHSRSKVEALNPAGSPPRVFWSDSPEALAGEADIVVTAVKPHQTAEVLRRIRPVLTESKLVLSLAAALSLSVLREAAGGVCPVARLRPNLPAVAGKGVFALCLDDPRLPAPLGQVLLDLFQPLGSVLVLPEEKLPAFSALAGCGPAYACLFMEGMQNAAVAMGFNAREAKELVAGTVEGTARLALESSEGFAELRARVCSPAGMTIYAVNHLERTAVRGHVTDAVLEALRRDREISGG